MVTAVLAFALLLVFIDLAITKITGGSAAVYVEIASSLAGACGLAVASVRALRRARQIQSPAA